MFGDWESKLHPQWESMESLGECIKDNLVRECEINKRMPSYISPSTATSVYYGPKTVQMVLSLKLISSVATLLSLLTCRLLLHHCSS